MKRLARDIQHFTPLIGIFVAGILGFAIFSYDKIFQATVIVAVAVAYFFWGLIHHSLHNDLHISIVLEYAVIAALGVTIIFSLLFRA